MKYLIIIIAIALTSCMKEPAPQPRIKIDYVAQADAAVGWSGLDITMLKACGSVMGCHPLSYENELSQRQPMQAYRHRIVMDPKEWVKPLNACGYPGKDIARRLGAKIK